MKSVYVSSVKNDSVGHPPLAGFWPEQNVALIDNAIEFGKARANLIAESNRVLGAWAASINVSEIEFVKSNSRVETIRCVMDSLDNGCESLADIFDEPRSAEHKLSSTMVSKRAKTDALLLDCLRDAERSAMLSDGAADAYRVLRATNRCGRLMLDGEVDAIYVVFYVGCDMDAETFDSVVDGFQTLFKLKDRHVCFVESGGHDLTLDAARKTVAFIEPGGFLTLVKHMNLHRLAEGYCERLNVYDVLYRMPETLYDAYCEWCEMSSGMYKPLSRGAFLDLLARVKGVHRGTAYLFTDREPYLPDGWREGVDYVSKTLTGDDPEDAVKLTHVYVRDSLDELSDKQTDWIDVDVEPFFDDESLDENISQVKYPSNLLRRLHGAGANVESAD